MNSFGSLLKIQIKQSLSILSFKTRKNKKGTTLWFVLLFAVLIAASFFSMYYQSASQMAALGMSEMFFLQAGLTSVLFVTIFLSTGSYNTFYKSKDYELLASLPIKSRTIVSAKLSSILILGYFFTAVTLLPAFVAYFLFVPFNFGVLMLMLLGYLVFPFLPTLLSALIGLLFAIIFTKAKRAQLWTSLIYMIVTIAYYIFYIKFNDIILFFVDKGINMNSAINIILPSVGLFISGILKGGVLETVLYFVINFAALAITIWFISASYSKINFALSKKTVHIYKGDLVYKQKSITKRLLLNESKRYFGISVYVFNTLSIALMSLVMPFVLYSQLKSPQVALGIINILPVALIMSGCLFIANCNIAVCSISIEGSKFEILKTLPLSPMKIIWTKILFNLLLVAPFLVLTIVFDLILFAKYLSLYSILGIIFLPVLATFGLIVFGMYVNLSLPKMKYDNYTQVVKQSASVGVGVSGGLVIAVLPFIIYLIWLTAIISIGWFLLITFTYFFAFATTFLILLQKNGTKKFNKININN